MRWTEFGLDQSRFLTAIAIGDNNSLYLWRVLLFWIGQGGAVLIKKCLDKHFSSIRIFFYFVTTFPCIIGLLLILAAQSIFETCLCELRTVRVTNEQVKFCLFALLHLFSDVRCRSCSALLWKQWWTFEFSMWQENLFTNWTTVSFSRTTFLHGVIKVFSGTY
jgi:hypothetical protein